MMFRSIKDGFCASLESAAKWKMPPLSVLALVFATTLVVGVQPAPVFAAGLESWLQKQGDKIYQDTKKAIQDYSQPSKEAGDSSKGQDAAAPKSQQTQPQLQSVDAPRYNKPWVTEIQTHLTRLGYNPGPIDGAFGNKSRLAISAFQRQHGDQETGLPTPSVMQALRGASQAAAVVSSPATPSTESLATPNCEQPTSMKENVCCGNHALCEQYGYHKVVPRLPDCQNPGSDAEKRCCAAPASGLCARYGFKRPQLGSKFITSGPAATSQGVLAQSFQVPAAGVGQIKWLTAADVVGAKAIVVRKSEIPGGLDARIAGCGGARDPVIRHNVMLILKAPQGQVADSPTGHMETFIKNAESNYDYAFDYTMKQIASQKMKCTPGAVEQAYTDYAELEQALLDQITLMRQEQGLVPKPMTKTTGFKLRTPNCDNPQTYEDKACCESPQICQDYGLKRPPLRTPDCDNPQSSGERRCCYAHTKCNGYGFERPTAGAVVPSSPSGKKATAARPVAMPKQGVKNRSGGVTDIDCSDTTSLSAGMLQLCRNQANQEYTQPSERSIDSSTSQVPASTEPAQSVLPVMPPASSAPMSSATKVVVPGLRMPNCGGPQSSGERLCCMDHRNCEGWGFERPPLRSAPNCDKPRNTRESRCCTAKSSDYCVNMGFEPPPDMSPAAPPE